MTIHEMMHQVALLSGGKYSKEDKISAIEIPVPGNRKQIIYGKMLRYGNDLVGMFYAEVGPLLSLINLTNLLELNAHLRYSKIAVLDGLNIALTATVELDRTSVKECAPILQEIAAMADELEKIFYDHDVT